MMFAKNSPREPQLLRGAVIRQVEQLRGKHLKMRSIHTPGRPHAIEVARLLLGSHETAVEPHTQTPGRSEHGETLAEAVKQLTPPNVPPKPILNLVPPGRVLPAREQPSGRIERRNRHTPNLSVVFSHNTAGCDRAHPPNPDPAERDRRSARRIEAFCEVAAALSDLERGGSSRR